VQETGFGGLDLSTIQLDDACAFGSRALGKGAEEPRLPDPGDAMQMHHDRPRIGQNIQEQAQFFGSANETSGDPAIQ
jgi:hypothetical protein